MNIYTKVQQGKVCKQKLSKYFNNYKKATVKLTPVWNVFNVRKHKHRQGETQHEYPGKCKKKKAFKRG